MCESHLLDVDPDEKERAEQIIAECAPELLERVENGTANPSECYMYDCTNRNLRFRRRDNGLCDFVGDFVDRLG